MKKKKEVLLEKAIRYDMLKQLHQAGVLTTKMLKAVFEDGKPVDETEIPLAEDSKEKLEQKPVSNSDESEAKPVIEVTPEDAKAIPVATPELLEDAKQTAEKYKKPRRKIDHGKVKALFDAGWSQKEIAAEMHCAEVTVYKILAGSSEKKEK